MTTSSKEWMKAKTASAIAPGRITGSVTLLVHDRQSKRAARQIGQAIGTEYPISSEAPALHANFKLD
ncbi:hypothetical protein [Bradyrhizobium sp. 170]|uniref:hypothetical protein n=1 Tax=Bradyrhizobium sp. 170 TaxID=2782641 RepID=UPI001FFFAA9A|nr:hypothetical protein [Bradyrhizobium sp. 170]UPK05804.1 hypothetical protein IVB05_09635 [Bradyrhizobium sp. 170]